MSGVQSYCSKEHFLTRLRTSDTLCCTPAVDDFKVTDTSKVKNVFRHCQINYSEKGLLLLLNSTMLTLKSKIQVIELTPVIHIMVVVYVE